MNLKKSRALKLKTRIITCFILAFFAAGVAFPHNPQDIMVEPNFEKNQLYIKVKHIVQKPRKFYIRKIEVVVDNKKPLIYRFNRQKKTAYQDLTIDLANLGEVEHIKIKAYPMRGFPLQKEFNIQALKEQSSPNPTGN